MAILIVQIYFLFSVQMLATGQLRTIHSCRIYPRYFDSYEDILTANLWLRIILLQVLPGIVLCFCNVSLISVSCRTFRYRRQLIGSMGVLAHTNSAYVSDYPVTDTTLTATSFPEHVSFGDLKNSNSDITCEKLSSEFESGRRNVDTSPRETSGDVERHKEFKSVGNREALFASKRNNNSNDLHEDIDNNTGVKQFSKCNRTSSKCSGELCPTEQKYGEFEVENYDKKNIFVERENGNVGNAIMQYSTHTNDEIIYLPEINSVIGILENDSIYNSPSRSKSCKEKSHAKIDDIAPGDLHFNGCIKRCRPSSFPGHDKSITNQISSYHKQSRNGKISKRIVADHTINSKEDHVKCTSLQIPISKLDEESDFSRLDMKTKIYETSSDSVFRHRSLNNMKEEKRRHSAKSHGLHGDNKITSHQTARRFSDISQVFCELTAFSQVHSQKTINVNNYQSKHDEVPSQVPHIQLDDIQDEDGYDFPRDLSGTHLKLPGANMIRGNADNSISAFQPYQSQYQMNYRQTQQHSCPAVIETDTRPNNRSNPNYDRMGGNSNRSELRPSIMLVLVTSCTILAELVVTLALVLSFLNTIVYRREHIVSREFLHTYIMSSNLLTNFTFPLNFIFFYGLSVQFRSTLKRKARQLWNFIGGMIRR